MTKEQVEKIFRKNIQKRKETPKCARGAVRACNIFADPHVTPFSGAMYNAQVLGDWVAYGGFRLESHYRGKSMGSWVSINSWGVLLDGHRIESQGFSASSITVDGQHHNLGGKHQVGDGSITKSGNTITFSIDGEEVSFTTYGSYFNMAARSNVINTRGLCNHQFVKSGYFGNAQEGHFGDMRKPRCHKKEHYREFCKKRGLFGEREFACMLDRCSGMKRGEWERIHDHIERGFKKRIMCGGRRERPREHEIRRHESPRPFNFARPVARPCASNIFKAAPRRR